MAHYIDSDKLRAEIERQEKHLYESHLDERGAIVAFEHILSFLDTLQELEVDLKKEIAKVCAEIKKKNPQHRALKPSGIEKIARHFYSLGQRSFDNAPRIKGWVARDLDGTLLFSLGNKPTLQTDGTYDSWDDLWFTLKDEAILPKLKHEDGPIEVELLIREVI